MNRTELAGQIAVEFGLPASKAVKIIDEIAGIIMRDIAAGNNVQISGFGTFSAVTRAPRIGRNPRTGEAVRIPEQPGVKFKAGKKFKGMLG